MGAVIALIAVLTVMLSGLASGLVNDGVSGLKSLPVTAVSFDAGTKIDNAFSRSVVDATQLAAWRSQPNVADAAFLGVRMANVTTGGGKQVDLTLFGVEPDSFLAPATSEGKGLSAVDGIVVSPTARAEGLDLGTVVTIDHMSTRLVVVGFTDGQATFGHVDVAYLPLPTWQLIASGYAQPGAPTQAQIDALDAPGASVVALQPKPGASLDLAAGDSAAHTVTRTLEASLAASPGYTAETMTLSMIQVFLYAICALVVGAFFTVWTIQRKHEIAVLRAIGASTRYLLRDGLTQAALLLVGFTGLGVAVGVGLGLLMPDAMPFSLELAPIAVATALTIGLGLLGAAAAVVRIAQIDPLDALAGQR
ncbi:MAG TPA: ABC transporter permease [Candidatus Limnocylindrales bacterium]